jgi:hypothetical protein
MPRTYSTPQLIGLDAYIPRKLPFRHSRFTQLPHNAASIPIFCRRAGAPKTTILAGVKLTHGVEKDIEMQFGFLRLALVIPVIFDVTKAVGREERLPDIPTAALIKAYPNFLDRIDGNDLVWKDGTRMVIDDGKGFEANVE